MGLFGIVYEGDTAFNHYQVADTMYQGRPARVLYSGNNDAAQSGIAKDNDDNLLFDYNQRFLELIRGIKPQSVLILGGGAFTLPAAVMQEFPQMDIDVVELDGGLLNLAQQYFDFKPTAAHVRVHIGDGRAFLHKAQQTYDVIVVDVFAHAAIPESFQTMEFVSELKDHLTKKGVVAMNVIASIEGRRSEVLHRLRELMQATFMDVQIFPASRGLSSWVAQNYVLTAQTEAQELRVYLNRDPVDLNGWYV